MTPRNTNNSQAREQGQDPSVIAHLNIISAKDKEIAELHAKLAAQKGGKNDKTTKSKKRGKEGPHASAVSPQSSATRPPSVVNVAPPATIVTGIPEEFDEVAQHLSKGNISKELLKQHKNTIKTACGVHVWPKLKLIGDVKMQKEATMKIIVVLAKERNWTAYSDGSREASANRTKFVANFGGLVTKCLNENRTYVVLRMKSSFTGWMDKHNGQPPSHAVIKATIQRTADLDDATVCHRMARCGVGGHRFLGQGQLGCFRLDGSAVQLCPHVQGNQGRHKQQESHPFY